MLCDNCRVFLFSLSVRGKPTPLAPTLVAFLFTSTNGYMQGRYLTHFVHYDLSWFYDPRFLLGHVIFLAGMAINIHSDATLRSLRKQGDTSYKIPYGNNIIKFMCDTPNRNTVELYTINEPSEDWPTSI